MVTLTFMTWSLDDDQIFGLPIGIIYSVFFSSINNSITQSFCFLVFDRVQVLLSCVLNISGLRILSTSTELIFKYSSSLEGESLQGRFGAWFSASIEIPDLPTLVCG